MKKKTLFTLLAILVLPLACHCCDEEFSLYPTEEELMKEDVIHRTICEISKKHDCKFNDIYYKGEDKGEYVALSFRFERPIHIKEARFLIVDCAKMLLTNINNDSIIRPMLATYPFSIDNISISIVAECCEIMTRDSPMVSFAMITEDRKVRYRRFPCPSSPFTHEETFERAVAILKEEGRIDDTPSCF